MSAYASFFFAGGVGVVEIELVEISHPSFSETYYLCRNMVQGVTVILEDGVTSQYFEFYPLKITPTGADTDLDQTMEISFGDLGEIIPQELDRVQIAGTFSTKPVVIYRTYRSDVLTAPMQGPVVFQCQTISHIKEGATLNITAPKLNSLKTGEPYNLDRFTALRSI